MGTYIVSTRTMLSSFSFGVRAFSDDDARRLAAETIKARIAELKADAEVEIMRPDFTMIPMRETVETLAPQNTADCT